MTTENGVIEKERTETQSGTLVSYTVPNIEQLEDLETREVGYSLVPKYRTQEEWARMKDEEERGVFLGFKEIPNKDGELIKAAAVATSKGVYLSGAMLLVDALSRMPHGQEVAITYLGSKKNQSTKGSTNVFDVKTLKPAS